MYTKFYGFREKPFNLTPDSHFLYLSAQHKDALGHLLYGIRERKGFILISGEVGTGKTTLCRALIRQIEDEADIGFILNTFLSAKELLRAINDDLFGRGRGRTKKELVDELNDFLLRKHAEGRTVVLLIDECQNLSDAVLEQIRMLSNLETEKSKLLQIVMVGQPEISEKLEKKGLRQLAQRISVLYHLQPLDYDETVNYIYHRMRIATGGEVAEDAPPAPGILERGMPVRFSRSALKRVFTFSGGVPRKINVVCDRALLIGYTRGRRRISEGIIRDAIGEVRRPAKMMRKKRARRWRAAMLKKAAVAGTCAAAAILIAVGYREMGAGGSSRRAEPQARDAGGPRPGKGIAAPPAPAAVEGVAGGDAGAPPAEPAAPAAVEPHSLPGKDVDAAKNVMEEARVAEVPVRERPGPGAEETEMTEPSVPERVIEVSVESGPEPLLPAARGEAAVAAAAERPDSPVMTIAARGGTREADGKAAVEIPVVEGGEGAAPREEVPPVPAAGTPAALPPELDAAIRLAGLWGAGNGGAATADTGERDVARLAESFGMTGVACWADVDFIRQVNLPCIIRLRSPGKGAAVPAVLISMEGDGTARIYSRGGEESVSLDGVASGMSGRTVYYCPAGFDVGSLVAPGMHGEKVAELQEFLREKGWLKGEERGWYGPDTVRAVKRFQNNCGLPRDGITGLNENMIIRSESFPRPVPRLAAKGGGNKP